MFRRLTAIGLAASIVFAALPDTRAQEPPFPDMQRSWYRYQEAVEYLRDRGVIQGYEDPSGASGQAPLFKPKNQINRAELLKIVFAGRATHMPRTGSGGGPVVVEDCFADVTADLWFAPFVCAAQRRGIVSGYPGTENGSGLLLFRPEQTVNFAEAIKIILNSYEHDIAEGKGEKWYEPAVAWLDDKDVLARHSYLPWAPLNRERAADLIARILRYQENKINPRESPGCGKTAPQTPSTVMSLGVERAFLLTVPRRYDKNKPTPLIIAFHGRTNSNDRVRSYMRLDREGDDFFIAYPSGVKNSNSSYNWANGGDPKNFPRDIALFDALVENLADRYCIDMDRIFVVGHSLGGWFANTVACIRGDVVRGSATVGGGTGLKDCAGPVAAMIAHNPKDQSASFREAELTRDSRLEANACGWETKNTGPAGLKCVTHQGCSENPILWCPHGVDFDERGVFYPHTWPRETGRHIIDFFRTLK